MKKFVVNRCVNFILKYNPEYSNTTIEEIKYGVATLYNFFIKCLIIFPAAYFLNIFKEFIIFCIIYNIIRIPSFGLHATTNMICAISSLIIFTVVPYISILIEINPVIQILVILLSSILLIVNSPADTKKRPIINKKRRKIYKFMTFILCVVYILVFIVANNLLLKNIIMFSLILQSILTSPITYRLFKLPYNNYLNYVQ